MQFERTLKTMRTQELKERQSVGGEQEKGEWRDKRTLRRIVSGFGSEERPTGVQTTGRRAKGALRTEGSGTPTFPRGYQSGPPAISTGAL
jgi:hypothetical protein